MRKTMINAETALSIARRRRKKDEKDTTEKDYKAFLRYLNRKIKKACKKGEGDYLLNITCSNDILDRLKNNLKNMGYTVIIIDNHNIRISWEN